MSDKHRRSCQTISQYAATFKILLLGAETNLMCNYLDGQGHHNYVATIGKLATATVSLSSVLINIYSVQMFTFVHIHILYFANSDLGCCVVGLDDLSCKCFDPLSKEINFSLFSLGCCGSFRWWLLVWCMLLFVKLILWFLTVDVPFRILVKSPHWRQQ